MTSETKVILALLLDSVAKATSVREAYNSIATAAGVEGMDVLSYDAYLNKLEEQKKIAENDKL